MTLNAQRISYISYSSRLRGKSLRVNVKYMLNNHLLPCLA
jgi:hypothetical protein